MSKYKATGIIEDASWKGKSQVNPYQKEVLAVGLTVAIPASQFTGLDLTRPITITQEPTPDSEPADWAAPGGDVR